MTVTPAMLSAVDFIAGEAPSLEAELVELCSVNSGSRNLPGLDAKAEMFTNLFSRLDPDETVVEELRPETVIDDDGEEVRLPLGRAVRLIRRGSGDRSVLLVGHYDTVFGPDHPFQSCRKPDPYELNGPGAADMHGGLLVMHTAVRALENSPWAGDLGWEIILTPDEEIGSPGSRPVLAAAASRHTAGLVFEPSLPNGNLAGARKGSGNFTVVVKGKAAHAGRDHHLGRNAVVHLARIAVAIDDLNGHREGVTVNPASTLGGGPNNIVPDHGVLRFNIRVPDRASQEWVEERLGEIVAEAGAAEGFEVRLHGGFARPPKEVDPAIGALLELAVDSAAALGDTLAWEPTGGVCDGNDLAAAGLPNIDNMGVVGRGLHSSAEVVELPSLVDRSRIAAVLLMRVADGELDPVP